LDLANIRECGFYWSTAFISPPDGSATPIGNKLVANTGLSFNATLSNLASNPSSTPCYYYAYIIATTGSAIYGYTRATTRFTSVATNTWMYNLDITYVSEIESLLPSTSIPTNRAFYLIYNVKKGNYTQSVTVSCRRGANNKLSQSAFSLLGNTFGLLSSKVCILSCGSFTCNDDMDTVGMLPNGNGFVSGINNQKINETGRYAIFNGETEVSTYQPVRTTNPFNSILPGNIVGSADVGTFVVFPKTQSVIYLNFTTKQYKINGGTTTAMSSTMSTYCSSTTYNEVMTISDGVNGFRLFVKGKSNAFDIFLNLQTNTILSETSVTYTHPFNNVTEEDALMGDTLYAIDGCISYYASLKFYYTPGSATNGVGWRDLTNSVTTTGVSSFTFPSGYLDTQTGMDLFGSIGADRYVWFADWGHDDGGLFLCANDENLGVQKTNIIHISDTYTN
jgi:hypothetical protein